MRREFVDRALLFSNEPVPGKMQTSRRRQSPFSSSMTAPARAPIIGRLIYSRCFLNFIRASPIIDSLVLSGSYRLTLKAFFNSN
ncbi:hypothetical protein AX14_009699 [Amanita brunnescens Koide BX004]|nr:hypothetical protein AX14_009699 [Amanita brunnescens Koide BX004]